MTDHRASVPTGLTKAWLDKLERTIAEVNLQLRRAEEEQENGSPRTDPD